MMEAIIKQEVIEKEPREVILTWKEKPKEQNVSKYDPKPKLGPFSFHFHFSYLFFTMFSREAESLSLSWCTAPAHCTAALHAVSHLTQVIIF